MTTARQLLGGWGEALAADYLSDRGYVILDRNVRTRYGEIDIIAQQRLPAQAGESSIPYEAAGTTFLTVFVEVKTRASRSFGPPEESVTLRKQAHLLSAVQAYLQIHPEIVGDWRIDVIAIQRYSAGQPPLITHFENAIS